MVVENVRRHLAHRDAEIPRRRVVVEAMAEVARPVTFSILIIALVLVPLLTLQGVEGKMFRPLALTMLFALLASIVVALTLVPALSERFLLRRREHEFGFVRRFHDGYLRLLGQAMRRPTPTLAAAGTVLLLSLGLIPFLGTEFIPTLDEGAIAINVVRLPNASLEGSVAVAQELERRVLDVPGGRDGRDQDRTGRDLRGSDGARAERFLHHAEAAGRVDAPAGTRRSWSRRWSESSRPCPGCGSPSRSRSRCA